MMDHKHILVLLWMLQSFSLFFYKIHLLSLSLFPHISNIAIILLIFSEFLLLGADLFFSLSPGLEEQLPVVSGAP